MVGSGEIYVLRESEVRRPVLYCCVLQDCGFSRREDVFTFNLLYKSLEFVYCKYDLQR
jgi:hypothetical protein